MPHFTQASLTGRTVNSYLQTEIQRLQRAVDRYMDQAATTIPGTKEYEYAIHMMNHNSKKMQKFIGWIES